MKIRAIITGATGMVGEGVLHECLHHPDVESVLSISRRSCGVRHEKLKEILHEDFSDFSALGVSSRDTTPGSSAWEYRPSACPRNDTGTSPTTSLWPWPARWRS